MARKNGFTYVSQDLRGFIETGGIIIPEGTNTKTLEKEDKSKGLKKGWFEDRDLESRIQPASFEPTLGDEIFVMPESEGGLVSPTDDKSIYRTILELPRRRRYAKNIEGGYELKIGNSYLAKLNERIDPQILGEEVTFVRSSPKSSIGRVFPVTRFLADYNRAFDEIDNIESIDKTLDMWLLIQPMAFNLIVHPGITMNQLRFFNGDSRLTPAQIKRESEKNPFLYTKDDRNTPIQIVNNMANDGVPLTVDLQGIKTSGIVGLRARKTPEPIDLSKREYNPEDFFDIITTRGDEEIIVKRDERYLFASDQIIHSPSHLNAELKRHHHSGLEGRTHDAGFIDPGFFGDMVFEVSPEEATQRILRHNTPLSRVEFFWNRTESDKIYGEEIGSNYQRQEGPKTSKHFKSIDFEAAAGKYRKLNRHVLVHDKEVLMSHRLNKEGFEPSVDNNEDLFNEIIENGFFQNRLDCEEDNLLLQPIPYILVFGPDETVFSYIRSSSIESYGDKRLFGKYSIGVGGHIRPEDGPDYIMNCLERELGEEITFDGKITKPLFLGTLYSEETPVDSVHLGLVYKVHTKKSVKSNEDSVTETRMVPLDKVLKGHQDAKPETWTSMLIPNLKNFYRR